MSILDKVSKPVQGAVICTITGDAGVGKTTLAATFPNPVFIRVEDGMQSISEDMMPDALPVIDSVESFWEQLTALVTEEHKWKTVVIDSVTRLERMFLKYVVDHDPKRPKSINQALGGYGAGRDAIGAMHNRVRKASGMLKNKGVNVVFIARADTSTIELPDQDAYTRYDLRLGKKSVAPYVDDVDLVGFIKLQTFTMGDGERKKAISDGTRIMVAYSTAANVSKNRYGITEDLVVEQGKNPLTKYIKALEA
ncbi:MAG: ATP-binding protein [Desulfoplanes sp.]